MWTKYEKFQGQYMEAERRLREGDDVPALREELIQKDEELLASME